MKHPVNALVVGTDHIPYEIRQSPRRRTIAIEVHADLRVIVRAPARADMGLIAGHVAERARWISRVLERFRGKGHQPASAWQYLAGETHHYLGQPYALRVTRGRRSGVSLAGAELCVTLRGEPTPARTRRALECWYRNSTLAVATEIIAERFSYFHERGHHPPTVAVRRMSTRWGSLADKRRMTLNLALIRAPRPCLEYVVTHELCHLEHRGHGRGFYRLMEALMPDWRARKQRLEAGWPSTDNII